MKAAVRTEYGQPLLIVAMPPSGAMAEIEPVAIAEVKDGEAPRSIIGFG